MPKRSYHNYWVYIVTNKPRGVLYTGFTGGIDDRMEKHKDGIGSYFASKYRLKRLVYYEEYQYVEDAIKREKQIRQRKTDKGKANYNSFSFMFAFLTKKYRGQNY